MTGQRYENMGTQPIDFMRDSFKHSEYIGFLKGNIIKYISRYKNTEDIKDLEKACIYMNWLIEAEKEDKNERRDIYG